jgi:4-oxalocrotonate tautomerase
MIEKATDAVVSGEGESLRPYTWVSIEELKSGNIGIGGEQITSGGVKELTA